MRMVVLITAMVGLTSCAVQKTLVPTGGSRSDGLVELSYSYNVFEKPQIDGQQGAQTAANRCAGWGYGGAQAFGGYTQQCQNRDAYGACNAWLVTVQYQCTGANRPQ